MSARLTYLRPRSPSLVAELRTVAPGIAIGPAFLQTGEQRLLLWFGLENKQS